jgi:T5orf172 domain
MNPGYIYILQNNSLGNNHIKIGMTTREPDIRAQELSRATGVPEQFHITFACKVSDCKLAEKKVHKILNAYRSNAGREFFFIAIKIAKQVVTDICFDLNRIAGYNGSDFVIVDKQINCHLEEYKEQYSGQF